MSLDFYLQLQGVMVWIIAVALEDTSARKVKETATVTVIVNVALFVAKTIV